MVRGLVLDKRRGCILKVRLVTAFHAWKSEDAGFYLERIWTQKLRVKRHVLLAKCFISVCSCTEETQIVRRFRLSLWHIIHEFPLKRFKSWLHEYLGLNV